jgi:hypothetical protein
VDGAIWIDSSARGARLANLFLTTSDPAFDIPLKVQAARADIRGNVITGRQNTICVVVGSDGPATGAVIEGNRISHCGLTDKFDHLIYLVHSRGVVVRDNVLSHNPGGWAVHLYPDADGTLIEHNLIYANQGGVIFAGDGGQTSDGNVVQDNAIFDSSPRFNIEGSWSGGPTGSGNVAQGNCLFTTGGPGAPAGVGDLDGFDAHDNVIPVLPPFSIGPRGGYRLTTSGPCAGLAAGPVASPGVGRSSSTTPNTPRQR